MFDQQTTIPQDPGGASARAAAKASADAAQAAAAAQNAVAGPAPVGQGLQQLTYNQLQAQLRELQDQRSTLANRRQNLAESYERASGANREGVGARLQMLDNNIIQYEYQIAAVGREMAAKAPTRTTTQGQTFIRTGHSDEDMAAAIFSTFLGTALLTVLILRRFARRRWAQGPRTHEVQPGRSDERLDRIEQAVDTIAVEIERVSENQRFMTRLMTETQLGASLAAVRSSTEMAKSAAEGG